MTAIAVALIAPAGIVSTNVTGISGAAYGVDANGFVTVTTQGDVLPFLNAGYRYASLPPVAQAIGANGLAATPLRLTDARTPSGVPLAASAAAGVLGVACTLGSALSLVSEAANSNTKTDSALWEYVLPPNYITGQAVVVTLNAAFVIGSGVLTTKTLAVAAYRTDKTGAQGANLASTPAATLTGAAADYAFTVAGATLSPGDRLLIQATVALTETSGHNVTANVNSARLS